VLANRSVDLVEVDALLLFEALGNQTRLVPLDFALVVQLDLENC
jgi:hypothetical protein